MMKHPGNCEVPIWQIFFSFQKQSQISGIYSTKLGQGLLLIWSFWRKLTGHQLETQHSEFQVAPSFTDHILILKPEFGSLVSNMSLFSLETNALQCQAKAINLPFCLLGKVIYTKYSKHWPYTVAHTIDCVCRKC